MYMGAVDYIVRPVVENVLLAHIKVHLKADVPELMKAKRFHQMQGEIMSILADMINHRDHATGGHAQRTSIYIKILLDEMDRRDVYTKETLYWKPETIIPSARLHDVGKIVISDVILNKPDKLSYDEFELIKTHTTEGERIIERMITQAGGGAFLSHAKVFAGSHHERWDGTGYPRGLRGMDIPLEGRVLAIADVYDALISERPYKKAFTAEKAEEIILDEAGKQFDPQLVEVFHNTRGQFRAVELVD
jgi:putative two-component system response regulator